MYLFLLKRQSNIHWYIFKLIKGGLPRQRIGHCLAGGLLQLFLGLPVTSLSYNPGKGGIFVRICLYLTLFPYIFPTLHGLYISYNPRNKGNDHIFLALYGDDIAYNPGKFLFLGFRIILVFPGIHDNIQAYIPNIIWYFSSYNPGNICYYGSYNVENFS